MVKVAVMADLPFGEGPRLEVMDTASPAFKVLVSAARAAKGADFSVCGVAVPTRAAPD
jgi:peptidylprolyl isomerase